MWDFSIPYNSDFINYTVHLPPTQDNQPMDASSVAVKAEEHNVSNSLFTGGFNSVTRAHLMDKVIDSEVSHPQMAGSACSMPACDGKVMHDERGKDIDPCGCRFKICRDCYIDAHKDGGGVCPGCKEPYKMDYDDDGDGLGLSSAVALPALAAGDEKGDRALMKSNQSLLMRSQTGDFDHNRWLFETRSTYGYGNAYSSKDGYDDEDEGGLINAMDKPWKLLTRKTPIPAAIISPCRLLVLVRLIALVFFLRWRVTHPNEDARWLWGMSIVCEIWFAFSWLLDQSNPQALSDKSFDGPPRPPREIRTAIPDNPRGRSDLPGVDVLCPLQPGKGPPLVTANTILSILAVDYPVDKVGCYVSDDGGALLTFEAMAEAASFADVWVPFCRKHNIEPRNPDSYFNTKGDPTKNKSRSDYVRDRRWVKREYDEFKVRINGLPDAIRRRSDAFNAREEMRKLKQIRESGSNPTEPDAKSNVDGRWHALAGHMDIASVRPQKGRPPRDTPSTIKTAKQ